MEASIAIPAWPPSPPHKPLSTIYSPAHAHKPSRYCFFHPSRHLPVGDTAWRAASSSKHGHSNGSCTCLDGAVLEPILVDSHHPPTVVAAPGRRIVAVGDLHGDIDQARRALRLAGLLSTDDAEDRWIGGSSVLIQVGDILDRAGGEIAILSLLQWLKLQAELKGGAVFQVNGNHETMNVAGEFRYVDPGGFMEAERFVAYCDEEHAGDWEAALLHWRTCYKRQRFQLLPSNIWMPWNFMRMQKSVSARSFLFSPGGPLACKLSSHGVVLKVNDWLFAHGGILPHHVMYGLELINKEVTQWMKGDQNYLVPFIAVKGFDSVVWSRLFSREIVEINERKQTCSVLRAMLNAAGAKGLIVGHTPQMLGANSECEGLVWRIDVGMSRGVLHAQPEVLEIVGNEVKVVSAKPHYNTIEAKWT